MSEIRAGALLLATAALEDPNFARTVVLLLDTSASGALGVVLNRPGTLAVGQVLPPWGEVVAEPEVLFGGGPVETDSALAVALRRTTQAGGAAGDVPGFRDVVGRLALLDLDTPVELAAPELTDLRIFAGYSGWGAGQLEREVAGGHWYVVPGEPGDVFRPEVTDLWRDVLRRQPGELAWNSTRPADTALN